MSQVKELADRTEGAILATTLATLLPNADALLALEPEDLGAVIMKVLQQRRERLLHIDFLLDDLYGRESALYPYSTKGQVVQAIAEAWSWLITEGLIIHAPDQPDASWHVLTRRGQKFKTAIDLEAFRHGELLQRGLLHPTLDEKVRPLFFRGDYDIAVFQAFKEVEVAVRKAAAQPEEVIGTDLMRVAFNPQNGALTDKSTVKAEQEALSHLFAGAIGYAKNPVSHRNVGVGRRNAAQLIGFASHLLEIVEVRVMLS